MLHAIAFWLLDQLYLTWQQILTDITIPHLLTGMIFYIIVHKTTKASMKKAGHLKVQVQSTETVFKTHMQALVERHLLERHGGHPLTCQDPACEQQLQIVTDPTPR